MDRAIRLVYRGIPYTASISETPPDLHRERQNEPGSVCHSYKFLGRNYTRCELPSAAKRERHLRGLNLHWMGLGYSA